MLLSGFICTEERSKIVDFPYLLPTGRLLSILSHPQLIIKMDILTIFKIFPKSVWLLTILSFTLLFTLNAIKIKSYLIRLQLAIDYFGIALAKGIIFKC